MPQRKTAIKKLRQDVKRHARNLVIKSALKKAIKEFHKLLAAKKLDEAKAAVNNLISKIDKAANKGIIHKNNASRKKAQIMRAANRKA